MHFTPKIIALKLLCFSVSLTFLVSAAPIDNVTLSIEKVETNYTTEIVPTTETAQIKVVELAAPYFSNCQCYKEGERSPSGGAVIPFWKADMTEFALNIKNDRADYKLNPGIYVVDVGRGFAPATTLNFVTLNEGSKDYTWSRSFLNEVLSRMIAHRNSMSCNINGRGLWCYKDSPVRTKYDLYAIHEP